MKKALPLVALWALGLVLLPAILDAEEEPEEGAHFDYRRWQCQIKGNGFRQQVSRKVTIFNERGQGYADLSFTEDNHNKLRSLSIRVLDETGNLLYERGKKDLTKACGYGGVALYDDACTYYGTFKAQRFPYSVEYQYEVESKSLFYLRGCVFQAWIPVRQASYDLSFSDDVDLRYKTYGPAADVEPTVYNGGRSLLWRLDSLPALEDVDYLPPGSLEPARLALAPGRFDFSKYKFDGSTWTSVGESLVLLYRDRYLKGAVGLLSGARGQGLAAKSIYQTVRQDIRYVAIEAGVGGWRPYTASLTQERGFGDCKDMSTLLVSKLRLSGIESFPVYVLTRDDGPIDPAFPSFAFNHVISVAIIDGDTIWMDPTCDFCPYGELPLMDEDIDVLVGAPQGGVIWRTPASSAEENSKVRTTHFHIDAEGQVSFETELQARGNYARFLRNNLPDLDADETRRFIDRRFAGAGKKFMIDSYEIDNLDDLVQPAIIRIKATMRKAARRIGGTLYCSPFTLNKMGSYELADLEDREYPLNLYYPESEIDHILLTYDPSLAPDSIDVPQADSLAFGFGEVVLRSSIASDTIRISFDKTYLTYQVTPDQFDDFLTFRKKVKNLCNQHVKLITRTN